MATRDTRIWDLELPALAALRPAAAAGDARRSEVPCGALNRFFYETVGADHHWLDRLGWSAAQWQAHADRPQLETWLVHDRGTPAGYAEIGLTGSAGRLEMFGLLPGFQGRGLGGHLLTVAARRLFERGAGRVLVETCELDGPHARANYEARGFAVVRERREPRHLSAG